MIRMPLPANTSSNAAVNLLSRSRIRNLNGPARSPRSMSRLRACWAVHALVGCAVTPRMCTRRVSISITKKMYRRLRNTVPACKKSHAGIPDAWEARNCCQVGDAPRGGGREPSRCQDPADGSRAGLVPEAEEFALDAPVTPARVLPGEPPGKLPDFLRDRRASRGTRIGPCVLDQALVPGEQGGGCHDPVQPKAPGQQPRQGGDHGPVGPVRLRAGHLAAQDRDLMP